MFLDVVRSVGCGCYWTCWLLLNMLDVMVWLIVLGSVECYWTWWMLLNLSYVIEYVGCYWICWMLLDLLDVIGFVGCYWICRTLLDLLDVIGSVGCYWICWMHFSYSGAGWCYNKYKLSTLVCTMVINLPVIFIM